MKECEETHKITNVKNTDLRRSGGQCHQVSVVADGTVLYSIVAGVVRVRVAVGEVICWGCDSGGGQVGACCEHEGESGGGEHDDLLESLSAAVWNKR